MVCWPSTRPAPRQSGQRCAHHLAGAAADVARPADAEEALLQDDLAGAAALRAALGLGARLRAAALAGVARPHLGQLELRLEAGDHVGERDLEVVTQVRAALAAPAPPPAPAARRAEQLAEQIVEDVGEAAEVAEVEAGHAALGADAGEAEAVVGAPLLRVGEHRVGLGRLLEALLGVRIAGVAVGVVLERELAVGLLELVGARLARDAQDLVVVALRQGSRMCVGGRWWRYSEDCPPSVSYIFSVIL